MPSAIDGLNPSLVWKYFAAFSQVPRCSKHEAAASQFIVDTAKRLGLAVTQDRFGNVAVKKTLSLKPDGFREDEAPTEVPA